MISKEALEEFKAIWKKEFGEEISDEKALDRATRLLSLYKTIYKPITKEEHEKFNKRYTEKKN